MNERIRELHKQVMRWNDTPNCSYNAEFCVPEEYTQKLAELIVQEVCWDMINSQLDKTKVNRVAKHWGVDIGVEK